MSISVLYTRVSSVDQKTDRQRVKEDDSNKKRTSKNTSPSCLVDNSIQISNFDFTPRDFEITLQTIYLIQND